ncbi:UNVERIFIED_CONTAM: hypothetical protein FKN15_039107 [Acipenser sinensis]
MVSPLSSPEPAFSPVISDRAATSTARANIDLRPVKKHGALVLCSSRFIHPFILY